MKPSKIGQKFILYKSNNQPIKKTDQKVVENKNVDMDDLINLLVNKVGSMKIDANLKEDIYGDTSKSTPKVVDVDFKKELYIDKAEINKVTSEEIKGKVNNKLDKLKALWKRNGS